MPVPGHRRHQLKRIVLPSGKTIEVVYFEEPPAQADGAAAGQPAGPPAVDDQRDLHVCPSCSSELVYPTEWEEAGPEHWCVNLRCPNCEWTRSGVFSQDVADRFDEALEAGSETLTRDYRRLVGANMAEDVARFVKALEADAILPMDF